MKSYEVPNTDSEITNWRCQKADKYVQVLNNTTVLMPGFVKCQSQTEADIVYRLKKMTQNQKTFVFPHIDSWSSLPRSANSICRPCVSVPRTSSGTWARFYTQSPTCWTRGWDCLCCRRRQSCSPTREWWWISGDGSSCPKRRLDPCGHKIDGLDLIISTRQSTRTTTVTCSNFGKPLDWHLPTL